MTFRKYEKTYRIEVEGYIAEGKAVLTSEEEKQLFNGPVVITEKLDGGSTGIRKENGKVYLQKRRSNVDFSHYQYSYFVQWAYENSEKLKALPDNIIIYGELLRCVHKIYYDKLADWFIVFDIFDIEKGRYVEWDEVIRITEKVKLKTAPLIYIGEVKKKELPKFIKEESVYGVISEGIVVKNSATQMRGKLVKPEFSKEIKKGGKHWKDKPIRLNKVI